MRKSNFELLRILAMFGVMTLHAGFYGPIDSLSVREASLVTALIQCLLFSLAVCSVNVFVMISGFFSIKLKWKGVFNFTWQIVFWRILAILVLGLFYDSSVDPMSFVPFSRLNAPELNFKFTAWFVGCYLGLMLISPVLNRFADSVRTGDLGRFVMLFFVAEVVCDWLIPSVDIFNGGYSPFSFVGLYLAGRYFSRDDALDLKGRAAALLFVCVVLWAGLSLALSIQYGGTYLLLRKKYMCMALGYTTPTTLACSCLAIVAFKHLRLTSRFVNFCAASSFGVYLFHGSMPFYKKIAFEVYQCHAGLSYVGLLIAYMSGVYLLTIFLDQIRIGLWILGIRCWERAHAE